MAKFCLQCFLQSVCALPASLAATVFVNFLVTKLSRTIVRDQFKTVQLGEKKMETIFADNYKLISRNLKVLCKKIICCLPYSSILKSSCLWR